MATALSHAALATALSHAGLLTRDQAAEFLGVKSQTLSVWASTGRYELPFVKVGRAARYRLADLERFVESRTVTSSGEAAGL